MSLSAVLQWSAGLSVEQIALLIVSALLPGVAATLLQAAGQRVVPAASAQPIYAGLPLFAAGWACLVLGEPLTTPEAVAGAVTILAAVLASTDASPPQPPPPFQPEQRGDVSRARDSAFARGVVVPPADVPAPEPTALRGAGASPLKRTSVDQPN